MASCLAVRVGRRQAAWTLAATLAACTFGVGDRAAQASAPSALIRVARWHDPNEPASASTAPAGAHLTYFGGPVISNVQIVQVLYGGTQGQYLAQVFSTASPSLASFYEGVPQSAYFNWLTEYDTPASGGTGQSIGHGAFSAQVHMTPSPANSGSTVDDVQIQSELVAQLGAGSLPAPTTDVAGNVNTVYMIDFPAGVTITFGGLTSCVRGGFCGYHNTIARGGGDIYYAVLPDVQPGSGCAVGCGPGSTFGNQTSVASHELIESVTDPQVGLATSLAAPLGWFDPNNGEIGDICNAQQGTVVGSDGVVYTVQKGFSNVANSCIVARQVAAPALPRLGLLGLWLALGACGVALVGVRRTASRALP
jgi:hypothetical protein